MLELLRQNPQFRHFWFAQVASQIGDRVHTLAVIWLVYSWTRSGTALGLVLVASTLPAILIAPWAGHMVDRHDRRRVAILADITRSLLMLTLAALALGGWLNMTSLVVLTALISVASAFFNPATLAMLPQLVPAESLTRANAMSQLSANASGVLGFLAGSGLIAAIGVPAAFLGNGCSFALSALLLGRVAYRHVISEGAGAPMLESLKEGWQIVRGIPVVVRLLAPLVVINFLFSSLTVLIPIFAEGTFASGAGGMGVLLAAYAGGMLLGAVVLANLRIKVSVATLMGSCLLMISVAFLVMGLFSSFSVFLVMLVLIGLALNSVNISMITLFQRLIPASALGKFFSLLMAIALSAQPLSFGITGWLTDSVPARTILLACAAALFGCTVYLVTIRELRQQSV